MLLRRCRTPVLFLLLFALSWSQWVVADVVKIGVLSHRGYAATLRTWAPMADYLSQVLPRHTFRIVPLEFAAVKPHVADDLIDFVLACPVQRQAAAPA